MEDNGDGRLLYPNPAGSGPPVNSIRWELIRDGVEDYEMLYSLRERVKKCRGLKAARLRRVVAECERMTPGRKGYLDDPARFAALRERVLEALP